MLAKLCERMLHVKYVYQRGYPAQTAFHCPEGSKSYTNCSVWQVGNSQKFNSLFPMMKRKLTKIGLRQRTVLSGILGEHATADSDDTITQVSLVFNWSLNQ